MKQYRCYFLNSSSRIIGASVFHCQDDAEALCQARAQLAAHEYRVAVEVWHDDDYLGCVLHGDAADAASRFPLEQIAHDRLAKCPLPRKAS